MQYRSHNDVLCRRITLYQEEVPLLLRDPSALLIQMVLTMPCTLARGKLIKTAR